MPRLMRIRLPLVIGVSSFALLWVFAASAVQPTHPLPATSKVAVAAEQLPIGTSPQGNHAPVPYRDALIGDGATLTGVVLSGFGISRENLRFSTPVCVRKVIFGVARQVSAA